MTATHDNEYIVQCIYKKLKDKPVTQEELKVVHDWLDRSTENRKVFENLKDDEWLKEARAKYYAPGKEAGLRQLREQLFHEARPWYVRLFDFLVPTIR